MIEAKLEETRRRLLDLTRGNRLLNHRDKGQRTLRIVDELAEEVYRLLVNEGESMQFLALEEAPEEIRQTIAAGDAPTGADVEPTADALEPQLPLAPIAEAGADGAPASRHVDLFLQTTLSGEQLQTRLVHLAREAGSSLQEQGYNILFVTMGMVYRVQDWCASSVVPVWRSLHRGHALSHRLLKTLNFALWIAIPV